MTIKTQDGKIIKKDGKVSCECCDVCECGSHSLINPPSDPDFTKKLRGDAGVLAFTQVSINYRFAGTVNGEDRVDASGTMNGAWVDAIDSDPDGDYRCVDVVNGEYLEINRVFVGSNCTSPPYPFCVGACEQIPSGDPQDGVPTLILKLRSNGCLVAILFESFFGGSFLISNKVCPPNETANAGITVTINGVSTYSIVESPAGPTDTLAGFFNITFS
jgi:hypothetical protein